MSMVVVLVEASNGTTDKASLWPQFLVGLSGGFVGAGLAFVGQWLGRRQTSKLSLTERKSALRDDRKKAIFDFLDIMQKVEMMVDEEDQQFEAFQGSSIKAARKYDLYHQMLFQQKCLEVICSDALVAASLEYVQRMREIIYKTNPYELDPRKAEEGFAIDDIWNHMDPAKPIFIKLARIELFEKSTYEDPLRDEEQLEAVYSEKHRAAMEAAKREVEWESHFSDDDDDDQTDGKISSVDK